MPRTRLSMTALAATALVWVACQPLDAQSVSSDALVSEVQAALSRQSLERHARAITMYERPSGGVGENAAIDSIVASLRADGVPVTVHEFDTYASDPERGKEKGMTQFLDEKSFKPGLGNYKR